MTKKELLRKIKLIEPENDEQRNELVCALIGHSRIQTTFFGYHYCGRCGAQVGDTLGSIYLGASSAVIVGHNCDTCQENYKKCTWEDKLFAPDPFAEEAAA
jgi:hypothetical protein